MFQEKIAIWLDARGVVVELILTVLTGICVALNYSGISGGSQMLLMSMMTLAVYYFITAYLPPAGGVMLGIVAMKVIGISSSVCVVGLTFSILKLTGSAQMLLVGMVSIASAVVIIVITSLSGWTNKHTLVVVRGLILAALSLSVYMKLIEI